VLLQRSYTPTPIAFNFYLADSVLQNTPRHQIYLVPYPPYNIFCGIFPTLQPHKPGIMQIPVEPNLDKEIPIIASPQHGETYEMRAKIAANTALALRELGMDDNISPEEAAKAKEMFEKIKPAEEKNTYPKQEEKALAIPGVAMELAGYINHYEKQIVADKVQVRTIVVNRLMEISRDEDNKVALKALELLGKASDLFTERSEITVTHQTSDELKAAIKERINQLMLATQINAKTKTESRLDQLKNVTDVEAKEVKDANG